MRLEFLSNPVDNGYYEDVKLLAPVQDSELQHSPTGGLSWPPYSGNEVLLKPRCSHSLKRCLWPLHGKSKADRLQYKTADPRSAPSQKMLADS